MQLVLSTALDSRRPERQSYKIRHQTKSRQSTDEGESKPGLQWEKYALQYKTSGGLRVRVQWNTFVF